jgi:CHASE2 domain-containing sensor protein
LSGGAAVTPAARVSPYKGLAPYGVEDASYFFGRNRERDVVIANLRARHLTVVYGESGVGKSSLLNAGVLSELRRQAREDVDDGETPEFVPVAFSSWRDDPIDGLLETARRCVADMVPGHAVEREPDGDLRGTLDRWARELNCEFLIILDQFEEYFLYHGHEEGEGTFDHEFPRALNDLQLHASFLVAIREDAFAKLDRFKTRVPGLLDNYLRIRHLDERCAREAIERPLESWNKTIEKSEQVEIEPALVEAILRDVRSGQHRVGQAGQGVIEQDGRPTEDERVEAPFLQLVLTRLWDEEVGKGSWRLRPETLQRLGGVENIVQSHLDEAMRALPAAEQEVAGAAFYYLVTPEGTKIAQSVQTLAAYTGRPPEKLEAVLEKLSAGDTRILRPVAPPPGASGGKRYEIFHDVLAPAVLDWGAHAERLELERKRDESERKRREAETRMRRSLIVAVAFAAFALSLALYVTDAFRSLELQTVDARFSIHGQDSVPKDITIVGIDDRTLSEVHHPWPFSRTLHARVVDQLRRAGAKLIVFDVEFYDHKAGDEALALALRRAQPVVLGATKTNEAGDPNLFGADIHELALATGIRPASALVPRGGTVRETPYYANGLQSIGVVVAEILARRPIDPPELGGYNMWIDYAGPSGTIPAVSYSRILSGSFSPRLIRNKIVVIGAATQRIGDRHATAAGDDMAGAEIQANAINTVRRDAPLRATGTRGTALLIFLFSLLAPLFAFRVRAVFALVAAVSALVLYLVIAQIAFNDDRILPVTYPVFALIVASAGIVLAELIVGSLTQGRRMHGRL